MHDKKLCLWPIFKVHADYKKVVNYVSGHMVVNPPLLFEILPKFDFKSCRHGRKVKRPRAKLCDVSWFDESNKMAIIS